MSVEVRTLTVRIGPRRTPKPHLFDPNKDIPDLTGQVILITDGDIDLGFETARQLVKHNPAHICIACRSEDSAQIAISKLRETTWNVPISFLKLDLSSFASIGAAAPIFLGVHRRLDILIISGGTYDRSHRLTTDGYEANFGANVMDLPDIAGPALFIQLLLPIIRATSSVNPQTRIVMLSAECVDMAPERVLYDHASLKTAKSTIATIKRYAISRMASVHYTSALAEREMGIKCISVHPGHVVTALREVSFFQKPIAFLSNLFGQSVEKAAYNQIWAATSPDAKSGVFYAPVGIPTGNSTARNPRLWDELWNFVQEELAELRGD